MKIIPLLLWSTAKNIESILRIRTGIVDYPCLTTSDQKSKTVYQYNKPRNQWLILFFLIELKGQDSCIKNVVFYVKKLNYFH
ncbi:hypothetical protein CW306_24950 [Bacillus sp. BA3]|nr:hypothetical protein CW306_24950 [Bacillus sp. BA3]